MHFSRAWLFATLQTVVCQAPLSLGFSRQEYWNGLSCPPPGDLPDPGIESALTGRFFTIWATREAPGNAALILNLLSILCYFLKITLYLWRFSNTCKNRVNSLMNPKDSAHHPVSAVINTWNPPFPSLHLRVVLNTPPSFISFQGYASLRHKES